MSNKSSLGAFHLAVMRTQLSNSRTMLSHIHASIGLLLSGLGFLKFFEPSIVFGFCGWFFIFLSIGVLFRGILLYRRTRLLIKTEENSFTGF